MLPHAVPSPAFQRCLDIVLRFEGGRVDDPDDLGGRTAFGVTQAAFNAARTRWGQPRGDVWQIRPDEVAAVYEESYWDPSGAWQHPWPMDLCIFDAAVQHGVSRATRWAQECPTPTALLDRRVQFYDDIIAARPRNAKFRRGWMNRVAALRAIVDPPPPQQKVA